MHSQIVLSFTGSNTNYNELLRCRRTLLFDCFFQLSPELNLHKLCIQKTILYANTVTQISRICSKFEMVATSRRRHEFNYFDNYISFDMIPMKLFLISLNIHSVELC
jgi:hypothetical protein